jgi:hypothetical protein
MGSKQILVIHNAKFKKQQCRNGFAYLHLAFAFAFHDVDSEHAPVSFANVARSILPPDTIATTVPRSCPVNAAATAHPAAPSITT